MKCNLCGNEVTLIPSAKERAAKYGGSPAFYTQLFPTHTHCQLAANEKRVSELMEYHREQNQRALDRRVILDH